MTEAAVLMIMAHAEEDFILLTLRAADSVTHASQVAFPGGRLEEQDEGDLKKTAIRECFEEVGVLIHEQECFGQGEALQTITGEYRVTPYFAQIHELREMKLSSEVERAEWVKVSDLVQSFRMENFEHQGQFYSLPVFTWRELKVWGLTALILHSKLSKSYDTLRT